MSKPSDFLPHSCNFLQKLDEFITGLWEDGTIDADEFLDLDEIIESIRININSNADAFDKVVDLVDIDFTQFIAIIKEAE